MVIVSIILYYFDNFLLICVFLVFKYWQPEAGVRPAVLGLEVKP